MSTLAEIERAGGARLPEPRQFTREQINGRIAEDEAALQRLNQGARGVVELNDLPRKAKTCGYFS